MSKTYNIIKKLVSHPFDPALRNRIWQWLISPSRQKEKEEALFAIWNEYPLEADSSIRQSL